MGKLFGTDGVRGVAGTSPLDADTIYRIGYCLVQYLKACHGQPRILIARDTRESGPWIEEILVRAIADAGGAAQVCGVLSTPAVSILATTLQAQAGIMISASHNPYQDNGIKIFAGNGMKFSDAVEDELESRLLSGTPAVPKELALPETPAGAPALSSVSSYIHAYTRFLRGCVDPEFRLDGLKLVADCAHGSLSAIAPEFLVNLGANLISINCRPDGRNINLNAGSLHLERLKREVQLESADLGVAFDGDADRAIFVDAGGTTRDGDDILYLLAKFTEPGDAPRTIVGTVMANLGLEVALEEIGFNLIRTSVGDRYVLEEMLRLGAIIGGEQSGHIIMTRLARTGDGLLTLIKVLEIIRKQKKNIAELCAPLKRFPQVIRNVSVREKVPLEQIVGLREAEAACKRMLGPRSRIILRYSGTEKLARVMVEGEDMSAVKEVARHLALFFEQLK